MDPSTAAAGIISVQLSQLHGMSTYDAVIHIYISHCFVLILHVHIHRSLLFILTYVLTFFCLTLLSRDGHISSQILRCLLRLSSC